MKSVCIDVIYFYLLSNLLHALCIRGLSEIHVFNYLNWRPERSLWRTSLCILYTTYIYECVYLHTYIHFKVELRDRARKEKMVIDIEMYVFRIKIPTIWATLYFVFFNNMIMRLHAYLWNSSKTSKVPANFPTPYWICSRLYILIQI